MDVQETLRSFGLAADAVELDGSMSGASTLRVAGPRGQLVLKLTPPAGNLVAARRELRFYLGVQPPLRTADLLGHRDTDDGVALLLTWHRTSDPHRWTLADWTAVAHDLAALHASPAPPGTTPTGTWLGESLRAPDRDVLAAFWDRPGERQLLDAVLRDGEDLIARVAAAGHGLVHGDCHLGNVLGDDDGPLWIDWQAVGTASPALDLGFLLARAVAAGVEVPRADLLRAYAASPAVRRAVDAVELAVLLASWPQYARWNTPTTIDRVHRRVHELVRGG